MDEITERQREVLRYIAETIEERGFPPTIREIGGAFNIRSTNGVNDHLKALERKGYLNRDGQKSRTLVPTASGRQLLGLEPHAGAASAPMPQVPPRAIDVPLLGRVAAGAPLLAEQNYEDSIQIDRSFLPSSSKVFALRVKGDSMIGDGILNGDIVFVRSQETARAGEIVVAIIEGEATVKRYFPEGDRVRLQPSNPDMAPIYVDAAESRATWIAGVVVGVFRRLSARN